MNMKTLYFLLLFVIVHMTEAQTLVVLGTLQDGEMVSSYGLCENNQDVALPFVLKDLMIM